MATDAILGIQLLDNSQVNHNVTVNAGTQALARAGNDLLLIDMSGNDIELTIEQFTRAVLFRAEGNEVARVLVVPASRRLFVVQNSGSASLTVNVGATEIDVVAGGKTVFYADGSVDGLIDIVGS